MTCKTCGRKSLNEEANFCFYCGESFREHVGLDVKSLPQQHEEKEKEEQSASTRSDLKDEPVSFMNWLASYGLMFIPYVGPIAFIGFLIYWSVTNKASQTKKNWAKATLIFIIVNLVIFILYVFLVFMPKILDTGLLVI